LGRLEPGVNHGDGFAAHLRQLVFRQVQQQAIERGLTPVAAQAMGRALGQGCTQQGDECAGVPPVADAHAPERLVGVYLECIGRLKRQLARMVDGAVALLEARQVKGPWEIEALERALIAAEEALNAVVQTLKPGATEREAVGLFEAEVRRRGAEPCCPLITFGPHTAYPAVPSSDRVLRNGDLVRLDVGCTWQGYHADVTRTAVAGAPEPRQEAVFDAVAAGLDVAIAAARPGAIAREIFAATVAAVRAAGLPGYDRHHVGYGIGLDARESPSIDADSTVALEAGMVLRLETPYYEHGWGGAQLKETVLVTRGGPRVMNRSRRGLLLLD